MSQSQTSFDDDDQPGLRLSLSSTTEEDIGNSTTATTDSEDDEASEYSIITAPTSINMAAPSVNLVAPTVVAAQVVQAPVVHGVEYYQVPSTDMVYVSAAEQAREWYVVTRGVFLGVFKYSFQVDQATRKVSSAHGKKEDSLRDAVDHFNAARSSGWMRICVSSSESGEYETCADDSMDLELSDNDEICGLIAAFALAEDEAAHRAVPDIDATQYEITSGGVTTTTHWAKAGTAQLGGAHVVAQVKRKKRRRKRAPFYVVFVGKPSGLHTGWASAKRATESVSGNCLQGYATLEEARAALEFAQDRGWMGGAHGEDPIPRTFPVALDPHDQAAPPLSALCPSDEYRRYYCVYRGYWPGIFTSIIEAHLSFSKAPNSLHDSFTSISVAREQYLGAVEREEICAVPRT